MPESRTEAASVWSKAAANMLKIVYPTPREELAYGVCELPCMLQGYNPMTVKKHKDAHCGGLKHKYELNSFQVTGNSQEEKYKNSSHVVGH
jgi:hypothetical protein